MIAAGRPFAAAPGTARSRGRVVAQALLATLVVACAIFVSTSLYVDTTLHGDLDHHVFASDRFGVPDALRAHGFRPFFDRASGIDGWDGQFYLSIANDPLARADTAAHLDKAAYRYQRIGLPAVAWLTSRLAGRDWVSPVWYFGTSVCLVLLATAVGAACLARSAVGPWPILLWPLSIAMLMPLLNGLPDAAADAFLVLALSSLWAGRRLAFVMAASLAALSREAYVVVPLAVACFDGWTAWRATRAPASTRVATWLRDGGALWLVPVVVFVLWQLFVRLRFGVFASSQSTGTLGGPGAAWSDYAMRLATGTHPWFNGGAARREAIALFAFAALVAFGLVTATIAWRRSHDPRVRAVATALFVLSALYTCFGDVVMEAYTGFLKVTGLFFFVPPFLWAATPWRPRRATLVFLVVVDLFFAWFFVVARLHPSHVEVEQYTGAWRIADRSDHRCVTDRRATLALVGRRDLPVGAVLRVLSTRRRTILDIAVTDAGTEAFASTRGHGGVELRYRWGSAGTTSAAPTGERSFLVEPLRPGERRVVPLVVESRGGDARVLQVSLFQDGCGWFGDAPDGSWLTVDDPMR